MSEETKTKIQKLFEGEITITKRELWLIGGCCLFAGIVYGLFKAPYTHGVKIGSDNGSNNGNGNSAANEAEDVEKCPDKKKEKKRSCCKKQDDIILVSKD